MKIRRPNGRLVIPGVDLRLTAGSRTVLCGPSGAGKSTLAQLCAGLLPRSVPAEVEGDLRIAGERALGMPAHRLCRLVASVLQDSDAQLCCRTVREEIRLGPQLMGLPHAEVERRAESAVRLTGLDLDPDADPAQLSGGQRQLLALAAALTMQTPLLVLDEAASRLDETVSWRVSETLDRIRRECGTTVLAVDHRLGPHLGRADRLLVLGSDGHIALDGPPEQVLDRNQEELAQLGVRFPGYLSTSRPRPIPDDEPGLALERLAVRRSRKTLLHEVSADFPNGASIALLGRNGAGKSTLLEALAGAAHRGRWRLGKQPGRQVRIGFAPERPDVAFLTRQIGSELMVGARSRQQSRKRLSAGLQLLRTGGLEGSSRRDPFRLSAGRRQRLGAVLALLPGALGGPQLLLLDEPTSAQDATGERFVSDLLASRPAGSTAVFATHDTEFAAEHATHALFLRAGRLIAYGPIRNVLDASSSEQERA